MSYYYFTATFSTSMRQIILSTTPLILRKFDSYGFWSHFFLSSNLIELIIHFILIWIVNGNDIATGKLASLKLVIQFYSYISPLCSFVQTNAVCCFSSNGLWNNAVYSFSRNTYWDRSWNYFRKNAWIVLLRSVVVITV